MPKCETHSHAEAVGYCHGCGVFGCEECLPAADEGGQRFCAACAKARGLALPKPEFHPEKIRHRYVVRFKDGRLLRGTFYTMDTGAEGFNFIAVDAHDATRHDRVYVRFEDLKAIFQVRSFKGHRRHPPRYLAPNYADTDEAAVYFSDGEVIRGRLTGHYNADARRFHLVPRDRDDNNILVIVEASAVDHVQVGGARQVRELRDLTANAVRKRIFAYYWRHRGSVVTLSEIARRIERVASAVSENLEPFVRHGLMERREEAGQEAFFLIDPPDPTVRSFLRASYEEIARFYFRREGRAASQARRS